MRMALALKGCRMSCQWIRRTGGNTNLMSCRPRIQLGSVRNKMTSKSWNGPMQGIHDLTLTRSKLGTFGIFLEQRRCLWGWLNSIFNRVDESRIKEVGPDRACAEWLLRCGASIKWDKGSEEWLKDYNSLPVGQYRSLKIVEIDATDSAVMHIGFPHFRGLSSVRKAVFHRCGHLEDEAVRQLGFLKETLEHLQISSCGNVTDEGLLTLVQMKKLKYLKLYDFLEVQDRNKVLQKLQQELPDCSIEFPFAQEKDRVPKGAKT